MLSILKAIFQSFTTPIEKEDSSGAKGEKIAVRFLRKNGYKILRRNYSNKFGEIDVIGYDHGTISFIEVKTRLSESFGPPELAVTQTKKNHIIKTAQRYITENKLEDVCCRFDVVSVRLSNDDKSQEINLLKNAFTL
ncbi:MAG: YraN family protein [Candidatus Brocadiales bacterium]